MRLQEFYEEVGGSLEEVSGRIPREAIIEKFLEKFLYDKTAEQLKEALEKEQPEEAFRAAHTLKGVCMNLGLGNLQKAAELLTEELRSGQIKDRKRLQEEAEITFKEYEKVVDTFLKWKSNKE